jgi:hypothetical protein
MRMLLRCPIVVLPLLMSGCGHSEPGGRSAAEIASRLVEQQGRHNEQAARQATEAAATAKRLVEADADALTKLLEAQATMQKELQAQRVAIDQDRCELERERRELAGYRTREPIIAEAIKGVGTLLACLIPLLLAGYVIHVAAGSSDDALLQEFLLRERVNDLYPAIPSAEPPSLPPLRGMLRRVVLRRRRTEG